MNSNNTKSNFGKWGWLIGFGLGLLWMTTIGLVSNFVTKIVMTGLDQQLAIKLLTVAAIVGIIGSYIWGWLDQKFGTIFYK